MADRYFQIQLQAQSTLAAYQPLCIQGGADAGLDGAILFPAVGERWITLPGDPETLQVSLLASEPGQQHQGKSLTSEPKGCSSPSS